MVLDYAAVGGLRGRCLDDRTSTTLCDASDQPSSCECGRKTAASSAGRVRANLYSNGCRHPWMLAALHQWVVGGIAHGRIGASAVKLEPAIRLVERGRSGHTRARDCHQLVTATRTPSSPGELPLSAESPTLRFDTVRCRAREQPIS